MAGLWRDVHRVSVARGAFPTSASCCAVLIIASSSPPNSIVQGLTRRLSPSFELLAILLLVVAKQCAESRLAV